MSDSVELMDQDRLFVSRTAIEALAELLRKAAEKGGVVTINGRFVCSVTKESKEPA